MKKLSLRSCVLTLAVLAGAAPMAFAASKVSNVETSPNVTAASYKGPVVPQSKKGVAMRPTMAADGTEGPMRADAPRVVEGVTTEQIEKWNTDFMNRMMEARARATQSSGAANSPISLTGISKVSYGFAIAGMTVNPRGGFNARLGQTSKGSAVSRNGQFVVFDTDLSNLVPGDDNGISDIYRLELATGTVVRVSTPAAGASGSAPYYGYFYNTVAPAINADGTRVSYHTDAQLLASDTDGLFDVYHTTIGSGGAVTHKLLTTGLDNPKTLPPSVTTNFVPISYEYNLSSDMDDSGRFVVFCFPDVGYDLGGATLANGTVVDQAWWYDTQTDTRALLTQDPPDDTQTGTRNAARAQNVIFQVNISNNGNRAFFGGLGGRWSTTPTFAPGAGTRSFFASNLGGGAVPGRTGVPGGKQHNAIGRPILATTVAGKTLTNGTGTFNHRFTNLEDDVFNPPQLITGVGTFGSATVSSATNIGATIGPITTSADGSLIAWVAGGFVNGRAFSVKNVDTGTLASVDANGQQAGLLTQPNTVSGGTTAALNSQFPITSAARYTRAALLSPDGSRLFATTTMNAGFFTDAPAVGSAYTDQIPSRTGGISTPPAALAQVQSTNPTAGTPPTDLYESVNIFEYVSPAAGSRGTPVAWPGTPTWTPPARFFAYLPSISGDNNTMTYITFDSGKASSQPDAGQFFGQSLANGNLIVLNRGTNTRTRLAEKALAPQATDGGRHQANDYSGNPEISGDGNVVAFVTTATNLDPALATDPNLTNFWKLAVVDRTTSAVTVLTGNSGALPNANVSGGFTPLDPVTGNGISGATRSNPIEFAMDAAGDKIVFTSSATNLTSDAMFTFDGELDADSMDTAGVVPQVFMYRRSASAGSRMSLVALNATNQLPSGRSIEPAISPDGNIVAFISDGFTGLTGTGAATTDTDPTFGPLAYGFTGPTLEARAATHLVVKNLTDNSFRLASAVAGTPTVLAGSLGWLSTGETDVFELAGTGDTFGDFMIGGDSTSGYKIVWSSDFMDIVAGNNNFSSDRSAQVYLWDYNTQTNTLISSTSTGAYYKGPDLGTDPAATEFGNAQRPSFSPSISANGQHIVFTSTAPLIASDLTGGPQARGLAPNSLYYRSVAGGPASLRLVNTDASGVEVSTFADTGFAAGTETGLTGDTAVSNDGQYVFFWTDQALEPGDTNKVEDIYVKNLASQEVGRLVKNNAGAFPGNLMGKIDNESDEEGGGIFTAPLSDRTLAISADATKVAFFSDNGTLIAGDGVTTGDNNGHYDVFVASISLQATPPSSTTGGWAGYE